MERLMRLGEVMRITSLTKAQIYRMISERTFPAPRRLSPKTVAWKESEVSAWMETLEAA